MVDLIHRVTQHFPCAEEMKLRKRLSLFHYTEVFNQGRGWRQDHGESSYQVEYSLCQQGREPWGFSKPWSVQVLDMGSGGRALGLSLSFGPYCLVDGRFLGFPGPVFIVCKAGLIVLPNRRVIVKIKIMDMKLAPCRAMCVLYHC